MKKWNLFLLITLAILSVSTATEAANWQYIGKGDEQTAYIDTSSISGSPNGPKEAWTKHELTPPDCTSRYAKSINQCISNYMVYERHFKNKTFCILENIFFFMDGTNSSSASSGVPNRIIPDSLGEAVWEYLYQ